jgi:hypothetical protein
MFRIVLAYVLPAHIDREALAATLLQAAAE